MNQEVKKVEEKVVPVEKKVATPMLDPAVLEAINVAVMGAVKSIVEQLKPVPAPITSSQAAIGTHSETISNQPPGWYKSKLKGIEVEPGQDLRHVHAATINKWFNNLENRWKAQVGARSGASASINPGTPFAWNRANG